MSKYLQLSMGFEEVAYKGLENDSRLVGSHVIKNGDIVLEIVNTLETVEDDNVLKFPYFQKDLERFHELSSSRYLSDFKVTTDDLVFDFVNNRIESLTSTSNPQNFRRKIYNKIISSRAFKNSVNDYNNFILNIVNNSETVYNDIMECTLIQKFLKTHSEGVMDISFLVEDVDAAFGKAVSAGAGIIRLPKLMKDTNGSVKLATITIPKTDIQHTLIQVLDYKGPYLPNYSKPIVELNDKFTKQLQSLPKVNFASIDHCVENYSWNQMMDHAELYACMFGFHKYWSADEKDISTDVTALRSIVMASANGKIKMPINEPVKGKFRGQIEEFHDFNGGPGVQHIALKTNDIIGTVSALLARGIEFNSASDKYYKSLQERLEHDDVTLYEDFSTIKQLNVLVDYDLSTRNKKTKRCNYLLQIFTKPLHDRPTLFIEIIQRHHHNGFGKGTFKGLYETIEEQQKVRGTLVHFEEDDFEDC
ncbi:4-hydroxyphenylpyruvate dioxygenase [Scheffersomyces xylosifermentans]|uniref:4-hydroxyphenylpyruvate dioxygenase n=1 Tax=Scheffersomyces xylosifermentans TaxID=1304137 RepID=UPI00315D93AE